MTHLTELTISQLQRIFAIKGQIETLQGKIQDL